MRACGSLEVLKCLHENGFEWTGQYDDYDDMDNENYAEDVTLPPRTIIHSAMQHSNLPVLQYLLENGHQLDVNDVSLFNDAVSRNNMELFRFLVSCGCKSKVRGAISTNLV